MDDSEYKQLQDMFAETVERVLHERDAKGNVSERVVRLVDSDLAADAIAYIQRQLNNSTFMADINQGQHNILLKDAIRGLFKLIYVKHYKVDDTHLLDKDPVFISCRNMLIMLFTRPLNGNDRRLEIERLKAKQQNNIIMRQS